VPTFLFLGSGEFEPWSSEVETTALAGAAGDGSVAIVPTASAAEGDHVFERWGQMGLDHYRDDGVPAAVVPIKTREDAHRDDLVASVEAASMIYFSDNKTELTHPQNNVFVARKAWVEKNPEEAAFLIKIWDRGVQEWAKNRDKIIEAYPEDFAAESDKDKAFIRDWLANKYDWFVESTYLDQAWVDSETKLFNLMKEAGYVAQDVPDPDFTILPKS